MNERTRTLAAITIIVGFVLLLIIIVGIILTGKKVLSPVPEEGGIKIIFMTPSPPPAGGLASPTATLTPTQKSR
jgi:hypothetical protein